LGLKYKNEKKFEPAIIEFRKVLVAYPDNYNTYMHLAEIYNFQKRYRLAIYNLKKSLSYNPGWGKAKKMLANVYEKNGQYPNAMKELQEYQQYCDPAERDSIQSNIDRIMKVIKYGKTDSEKQESTVSEGTKTFVEKPDLDSSGISEAKTVLSEKSEIPKESKDKKGKVPSNKIRKVSMRNKSEQEFKKGVIAYRDGIESQNNQLLDKALQHFQTAVKYNPEHAGAYYYAGLIRRKFGQNEKAKTNFKNSFSYPDLGHNAHFYLGKIYGEDNKYKQAIEQLGLYIKKTDYEPGKYEAQALIDRYSTLLRAMTEDTATIDIVALGKEELIREVSKIPEETKYKTVEIRIDSLLSMVIVDTLSDPGQEMLTGVKLFQNNQFDDAINSFKEVLLKYPNGNVAAHCLYDIGICYMKLKNYKGAENKFQQVLDRHRSSIVAKKSLFLKALTYYERHELKNAESLFRKFIQNYRNHKWTGKSYEKLGDIYGELMEDKRALDAYIHAANNARSTADRMFAWYKAGNSYLKINNSTRATAAFKKVISIGEKNNANIRVPEAMYKIADVYYKEKKFSNALDMYKNVTRKYPKHQDTPWGLFQIGSAFKNIKKYENAIEAFNTLINTYPDNYWTRQAQWKREDTVWEHEYRSVLGE
jgi:tetratricopeptide (TPR) repeat protein